MSNTRKLKRRSMPLASPIVERVSDADRAWFEQHPGAEIRRRPVVPGEFGDMVPRGTVVTVFQVAPGVRVRRVLE